MATKTIRTLPSSSGIYQIVNKLNMKRYIGYASNLRTRMNGHLYDLSRNQHPNDHLQKAWNKYKEENFSFEVLQKCEKESLCLYEDYWVRVLKVTDPEFGYNLKPTDPNGKPGQSPETIKKLRIAHKGRPVSEHCRNAANKYWKNNPMTEEHKAACKEGLKKVDWKNLKGRTCRKVVDLNSGFVYDSAARAVGIKRHYLCKKLLGTRPNNTNLIYL
jgi:group I intron endonuclease